MTDVRRVTPREAREQVLAGTALLVCAYEDPRQCASMRLEGAISLQEFRARRPSLLKGQPIIFYCS